MRTWKPAEPEVKVAILPCEGDCDEPTNHTFDVARRLPDHSQFWFRCTVCKKRRVFGTAHHGDDYAAPEAA